MEFLCIVWFIRKRFYGIAAKLWTTQSSTFLEVLLRFPSHENMTHASCLCHFVSNPDFLNLKVLNPFCAKTFGKTLFRCLHFILRFHKKDINESLASTINFTLWNCNNTRL